MNVYYQVTHKLQAPIIAGNVTLHTGFPVACVQTSPLPQEKSGEEMTVNRRR